MTINQLLQKLEPTSPILQANFGIERESLRVDRQGKLAHTPHPSCLGARSFHPYIQTDFCEFQMELITPVAKSTTEARRFLGAITDVAGRSISKDELLWPLSMPPRIKAQEIQVAQLENEFERHYRNYLAEKYGTKLQAISGIHYNMELGKDLVEALFKESDQTDMIAFKNALYLKLAQNYLRYRWVITYLFGAAPVAEQDFFDQEVPEPVRSFRNSDHGYVNKEECAEDAMIREMQEEIGRKVLEYRFLRSEYFPKTNTLIFNFAVVIDSECLENVSTWEVDQAAWFTFDEARASVKPASLAQRFLLNFLSVYEQDTEHFFSYKKRRIAPSYIYCFIPYSISGDTIKKQKSMMTPAILAVIALE